MTFGELLQTVKYDNIWAILYEHYELSERAYSVYESAFDELCSMTPTVSTQPKIIVVAKIREILEEHGWIYEVIGMHTGDNEHYALDFVRWSECLSFNILPKSLALYGADSVTAHILFNITLLGFSAKEFITNVERIRNELLKSESQLAQEVYYSHDEVMAEFGYVDERTEEEKECEKAAMSAANEENERIYKALLAD